VDRHAGDWCSRVTDAYCWVEIDARCAESRAALEVGDRDRAESAARRAIIGAARWQMDQLLVEATDALTAAN